MSKEVNKDINEVVLMPDKKKLTFKEIVGSILDYGSARALKKKVFFLKGQLAEYECLKERKKKNESFAKAVTKKFSLDEFMQFCNKKLYDCPLQTKIVLRRYWTHMPTVDAETRLKVIYW